MHPSSTYSQDWNSELDYIKVMEELPAEDGLRRAAVKIGAATTNQVKTLRRKVKVSIIA